MEIEIIGRIQNDFGTKFGIPRQSGMARTESRIVMEGRFRDPEYFRGLEAFSHIWLLWEFSENTGHAEHATVRPPRLGGSTRVGVFASRSPFRPNSIGLSCVRPERIEQQQDLGTVLVVTGADLMNGTPIYDIKPYLPFADSHPEALGGYTDETVKHRLQVEIPEELLQRFPGKAGEGLIEALALDPRPSYQEDPDRVYGMEYAGRDVKFRVADGILQVVSVDELR